MSTTSTSTAQSEPEKRSVTVTTTSGDPIIFHGNPAELAGARHEMNKCLSRNGSFELLIKHGAARLPNGTIAVSSVINIPFVTGMAIDPNQAQYDFDNPCPDADARINAYNAAQQAAGLPLLQPGLAF